MEDKFESLVNAYKKGALEDSYGLYEFISQIEKNYKPNDAESLQKLTLEFIRQMLANGFEAGNPAYSATGYIPWENQNPDYVIDRIKNEWDTLGKIPNMPDIAWFASKELIQQTAKRSK